MSQICYQIIGYDVTISMASEASDLELNMAEPIIAYDLLHASGFRNNLRHLHDFWHFPFSCVSWSDFFWQFKSLALMHERSLWNTMPPAQDAISE